MCVVGLNCLITLTMCFGVSLTKQFVLLLFLHERFDGHQLKITTTHLIQIIIHELLNPCRFTHLIPKSNHLID
jgi:hypothetical protein